MRQKLSIASILLVVIILLGSPAVHADIVYDPYLGKFVRVTGIPHKKTSNEQMDYAKDFYEKGQIEDAITAYIDLTRYFPESRFVPEALFRLGNLLEETDEHQRAFDAYQRIMDDYPNNFFVNRLLERQLEIAKLFKEGKRAKFAGISTIPLRSLAIKMFDKIYATAPYHEVGEKALMEKASTLEQTGKLKEAVEVYEKFLDEYPNSRLANDASYKVTHVMYQISQSSREKERVISEANQKVSEYIKAFPDSVSVDEVEKIKTALRDDEAENNYKTGLYYERQKRIESALIYYEEAIKVSPDSKWAEKARARKAVFQNPLTALDKQEDQIQGEIKVLEEKIEELQSKDLDDAKKEQFDLLKDQYKELKKKISNYDGLKKEEIKYLWEVHKRKKRDLELKKKKLAERRETLQENYSSEMDDAIKMWEDELQQETFALQGEKEKLIALSEKVNYTPRRFLFFKEPTIQDFDVEEVSTYHEQNLSEIDEKKETLEAKTQNLVTSQNELSQDLSDLREKLDNLSLSDQELMKKIKKTEKEVNQLQAEKSALEKKIAQILDVYQLKEKEIADKVGNRSPLFEERSRLLAVPYEWVADYTGKRNVEEQMEDALDRKEALESAIGSLTQSIEELETLIMDKKTGLSSFEADLGDLPEDANERQKEVYERKVRKYVKSIEKEINQQYHVIEDSNRKKSELLDELDVLVDALEKEVYQKTKVPVHSFLKPFKFMQRVGKAFLFGMETKEQRIQKEARWVAEHKDIGNPEVEKINHLINLEKARISIAKHKLNKLYDDHRKAAQKYLEGQSFQSILLYDENIFAIDRYDDKQRQFSLQNELAHQKARLRFLEKEKNRMDRKIKGLETSQQSEEMKEKVKEREALAALRKELQQLEEQLKDKNEDYRLLDQELLEAQKKLISISASTESKEARMVIEELKTAYLKDIKLKEQLSDKVEEKLSLLDEEEKLLREKLNKINQAISKYEGSQSEKMTTMINERKELFLQLDQLHTEKNLLTELVVN